MINYKFDFLIKEITSSHLQILLKFRFHITFFCDINNHNKSIRQANLTLYLYHFALKAGIKQDLNETER